MLFFPYSTDAPVYHYPIATGTIIATSVVTYFTTTWQVFTGDLAREDIEWLALQFEAIQPLQWLTYSFMHVNPFSMFVNMLFLWSFGLVIEGKIGWFWFSLVYLGIQAFCGAIAQVLFLSLSSVVPAFTMQYAAGADNGIFLLMAMALVWAPENGMNCVFILFSPRLGKSGATGTELKIVTLATMFLFIDLVLLLFLPTIIWQAGFHVLSMFIGFVLALYLIRSERVDCEDWDIISRNEWLHDYYWLCSPERRDRLRAKEETDFDPVAAALASSSSQVVSHSAYMGARSGTMSRARKTQTSNSQSPDPATQAQSGKTTSKLMKLNPLRRSSAPEPGKVVHVPTAQEKAQEHPEFNRLSMFLRQAIASGSLVMAEQHFSKLQQLEIDAGLADKTLFAYVKMLAASKNWIATIRPLQIIVAHGSPMAHDARIRIAQIQRKVLHQPGEAVKTLKQIRFDSGTLTAPQEKILAQRDQILRQCGVEPPARVAKTSQSK